MFYLTMMRHKFHPVVKRELRASHAGETGAVWIYKGVLWANTFRADRDIEAFAKSHLATEAQHLEQYEAALHKFRGSMLLFLWVIAGFSLGVMATFLGKHWLYFTIHQVESFVDEHYREQIARLNPLPCPEAQSAIQLFRLCNLDEIAHRDQALSLLKQSPTKSMAMWGQLVATGSALAANCARFT